MQEPQFSPFESETLTPAERQALQRARGSRLKALLCCVGGGLLALFAAGCPEPADLQDPASFPLPPNAGAASTTGGSGTAGSGTAGSGTAGSGTAGSSSGAECESACMATILSDCKACHGKVVKLSGTLDLETAGYTGRLKNQPAEHAGAAAAMCPTGDKLVDTATPANSWLLKKVKNDVGGCGTAMPPPPSAATPDEVKCFEDYVACVSGVAPAGGGTGGT